jgi:hypothetical protein
MRSCVTPEYFRGPAVERKALAASPLPICVRAFCNALFFVVP